MTQAAYYLATLTYLNAVKVVGSADLDKVMAQLRKAKIDDMFTSNWCRPAHGLMEHDMYIMQVKGQKAGRIKVPLGLLPSRPYDVRGPGVREAD
jgi:ABC-type branched-subunit amino acid transport system substrate-binding protein